MTKVDVSLPSDTEITVKRSFNAPASLVYDAHTRPKLVKRWLTGPDGWSMPTCEIDLRVGGRYRYVWAKDDGSFSFGSSGAFTEVKPVTRLAFTERMEGFDGESQCSYDFVEKDGRTMLVASMRFASREARDGALKTGMTDGMGTSYDRLDAVLAA
jgi:uncharacterized protein YndB with AHSA1/START domain